MSKFEDQFKQNSARFVDQMNMMHASIGKLMTVVAVCEGSVVSATGKIMPTAESAMDKLWVHDPGSGSDLFIPFVDLVAMFVPGYGASFVLTPLEVKPKSQLVMAHG